MKPAIHLVLKFGIALITASIIASAQEQGSWSAHFLVDKSLQLTLQADDAQQGFSKYSLTLPLTRLQSVKVSNHAQFALKAEAGTIIFDGVMSDEKGAGTYTFKPEPQFRKNMERVGFTLKPEQQLFYALNDVTTSYAKSMRDATGVNNAGRLLKMAKLHIDAHFAHKLSEALGENLEAEEVIEAARHGVTPEYVAKVHKLLPRAEFDDIGRMQRRDVSVQFITSAQKCHPGISAEEIEVLKRKYGSACAPIK